MIVQHDTTEYNIPINIEYRCFECLDRGTIWQGEYDDITEINCPFCNEKLSIEDQMDDDS